MIDMGVGTGGSFSGNAEVLKKEIPNIRCIAIEPYYVGLEERTFNFYRQVADAYIQQLLVTQTMPGESVAHGAVILAVACRRGQKQARLI